MSGRENTQQNTSRLSEDPNEMQTKRAVPKTELITLTLEITKPLPSPSSPGAIISRNTPPKALKFETKTPHTLLYADL
jgi:hypothetical protein